MAAWVRAAKDEAGRIRGLADCAGSILLKPADRTSRAEWDAVLRANLDTAFAIVRAAPAAFGPDGGSVALVSTAAATVGLPSHEAIAAAKAGIEGLVRAAAATYAPRGIRFNAVAPGLVDTPMSAAIVSSPVAREASRAMHPLGRLGEADEVAAALAFLLDEGSGWITGQVLGVDGGLARLRGRARATG